MVVAAAAGGCSCSSFASSSPGLSAPLPHSLPAGGGWSRSLTRCLRFSFLRKQPGAPARTEHQPRRHRQQQRRRLLLRLPRYGEGPAGGTERSGLASPGTDNEGSAATWPRETEIGEELRKAPAQPPSPPMARAKERGWGLIEVTPPPVSSSAATALPPGGEGGLKCEEARGIPAPRRLSLGEARHA